jgi:hypothetical protein
VSICCGSGDHAPQLMVAASPKKRYLRQAPELRDLFRDIPTPCTTLPAYATTRPMRTAGNALPEPTTSMALTTDTPVKKKGSGSITMSGAHSRGLDGRDEWRKVPQVPARTAWPCATNQGHYQVPETRPSRKAGAKPERSRPFLFTPVHYNLNGVAHQKFPA